jgi:RND family efflux transporter MFP subunit
MKRLLWLTAILGAAAIVALVRARSMRAESRGAAPEMVRLSRRDIASVVKATGVIKPRVGAEVRVGSRISGVVKRLYVQIGDSVRKGQLLAELDDRDLTALRDQAASDVHRLEVALEYDRLDAQRKRALAAIKAVPDVELEAAERALATTERQLEASRASLAFATAQLDYTKVTAPIGGVVASVSTQEGETVAASFSAPTFLTLLDPSRLEVWAYVDETDIGRIRGGQTARFTVDTYGDEEFTGRVTAVYPSAEIRDNVVNYVTVVRFQSPKGRVLRPEMTTTVRVAIDTKHNVLAVPTRALRYQDGRAFVIVRRGTASGAATQRRSVTTGSRDEKYTEILGGVRDGDEILIAAPGEHP